MKTLILLRHATASTPASGQSDHDRPLTRLGKQEARRAGMRMREDGIAPDLVICSTAKRTRETLAAAIQGWAIRPETRFLQSLFEGPSYPVTIRDEAGEAESILVVGHNPFIQGTAVALASAATEDLERGFPPSAYAVLTTAGPWRSIGESGMQLERFVRP